MRKLLILLLLVAAPLSAQWHRAKLFGADVRALIVDPSDPDTLYLGTSGGEVYVSHDAARTWSNPRNSVEFPGYVVDNLVIDRDGRLWAACWGLWGGGVIAVSADGGHTWSRRDAGLEDFSVRAIAVDPRDANFVVIGGLSGVYRSTNAGQSWEKISEQINVESLALDPRTHDRIYVGTWRQGIRTDDGGKSWKLINGGMVLDTDMFAITIDRDNPDDVWVATCGWVYNTVNRGDLWTRFRDGFDNRRIHDVEVDPCDRQTVYAGSVAGLYRTHDRGKNWYRVSDESLVVNNIALHPQRPHRIVLGVEGDGIYVSDDDAKTFTRSCDGLRNLTITSIAADPAQPKRVYASVMFGGSSSGIYVSDDAALTWRKLSATSLPPVLSLVARGEVALRGVLWTPPDGRWRTGVLLAHPRADFSVHYAAPLLTAAGYAVLGFGLMVASALAITRYLRQLGRDQIHALQEQGRFSLAGGISSLLSYELISNCTSNRRLVWLKLDARWRSAPAFLETYDIPMRGSHSGSTGISTWPRLSPPRRCSI